MRFRLTSRLHQPAAATEGEAVSALGSKRNAKYAIGEGGAPGRGERDTHPVRPRTLDRVCLPGHQARPWVHVWCQAGTASRHAHVSSGTPLLSLLTEENRHSSWKEPDTGKVIFQDLTTALHMYTQIEGSEFHT